MIGILVYMFTYGYFFSLKHDIISGGFFIFSPPAWLIPPIITLVIPLALAQQVPHQHIINGALTFSLLFTAGIILLTISSALTPELILWPF